MAYEHRIFIVEKTHQCYEPKLDMYFGKVLCYFNLGVMEEIHDIVQKYGPTDHFIYQPGNGDEEVFEDMYGKPLTEIPVEGLIWDLRFINANGPVSNTAIYPLLAALSIFKDDIQYRHRDIVCLHYGY